MAVAWASRASRSAFRDIVAATRRTNAASSRLSRASVRDRLSFIAACQVKTDATNVAEASAVALLRQELKDCQSIETGRKSARATPRRTRASSSVATIDGERHPFAA